MSSLLDDFTGIVDRFKRDPRGAAMDYGRGALRAIPQGMADLGDIMARSASMGAVNPRLGERMKATLMDSPLASTGTTTDAAGGLLGLPQNTAMKGIGLLGTFAGANAKTANLAKMLEAIDMAKRGVSREDIWNKTGWFRGPEGAWKFEIPDNNATFHVGREYERQMKESVNKMNMMFDARYLRHKMDAGGTLADARTAYISDFGREPHSGAAKTAQKFDGGMLEMLEKTYETTMPKMSDFHTTVGAVYHHPELYKAHPELANEAFRLQSPGALGYGTEAMQGARGIDMLDSIAKPQNRDYADSVMGHEVQHYIQEQSPGFARGGSPEEMMKQTKGDEQAAYARYLRLMGEAESRAVQARLTMSPLERQQTPPWMSYEDPTWKSLLLK